MAMKKQTVLAVVLAVVVVVAVVVTVPVVVTQSQKNSQLQQAALTTDNLEEPQQQQVGVGNEPTSPATTSTTVPTPTTATTTTVAAISSPTTTMPTSEPTLGFTQGSTTWEPTPEPVMLVARQIYDLTTDSGVDYYHCTHDDSTSNATATHLVLLHGMSFDREVWRKKTGIFRQFCKTPGIRVSALDLSVSSTFDVLQTTLEQIERQTTSTLLQPVVLVTPSASGWSMVSAMVSNNANGEWDAVPQFIQAWIPVAPVSLVTASDDQIIGAIYDNHIPVLAVYGANDSGGKSLSQRLGQIGQDVGGTVKVVELSGGHAAYKDSPDDFVLAVRDFIKAMV